MKEQGNEFILASPSSVQDLFHAMMAKIGEGHGLIRLETATGNMSVTLRRHELGTTYITAVGVASIHEAHSDGYQKFFVIFGKSEGECEAVADKSDEKIVRLLNEAQVQALITNVRGLPEV